MLHFCKHGSQTTSRKSHDRGVFCNNIKLHTTYQLVSEPRKPAKAGVSSNISIICSLDCGGGFGGGPPPLFLLSFLNEENSCLAVECRFSICLLLLVQCGLLDAPRSHLWLFPPYPFFFLVRDAISQLGLDDFKSISNTLCDYRNFVDRKIWFPLPLYLRLNFHQFIFLHFPFLFFHVSPHALEHFSRQIFEKLVKLVCIITNPELVNRGTKPAFRNVLFFLD